MSYSFCRTCGEPHPESAPVCPHCGAVTQWPEGVRGSAGLPQGVAGWSWGAFLLGGIWAIGNRTWIGLLAFIPGAGFIVAVVLGVKGREWAWKNRSWDSVEHFRRVQRQWSRWAVAIVFGLALIGGMVAIGYGVYDVHAGNDLWRGSSTPGDEPQARPQEQRSATDAAATRAWGPVRVPMPRGGCDIEYGDLLKMAGLYAKRAEVQGPSDTDFPGYGCPYRIHPPPGSMLPWGAVVAYRIARQER